MFLIEVLQPILKFIIEIRRTIGSHKHDDQHDNCDCQRDRAGNNTGDSHTLTVGIALHADNAENQAQNSQREAYVIEAAGQQKEYLQIIPAMEAGRTRLRRIRDLLNRWAGYSYSADGPNNRTEQKQAESAGSAVILRLLVGCLCLLYGLLTLRRRMGLLVNRLLLLRLFRLRRIIWRPGIVVP